MPASVDDTATGIGQLETERIKFAVLDVSGIVWETMGVKNQLIYRGLSRDDSPDDIGSSVRAEHLSRVCHTRSQK